MWENILPLSYNSEPSDSRLAAKTNMPTNYRNQTVIPPRPRQCMPVTVSIDNRRDTQPNPIASLRHQRRDDHRHRDVLEHAHSPGRAVVFLAARASLSPVGWVT